MPALQTKLCAKCRVVKPAADFHRETRRASGLTAWCKPCTAAHEREQRATSKHRAQRRRYWRSAVGKAANRRKYLNGGKYRILERQLLRLYGIDFHDWALMFNAQGGRCPICVEQLTLDHRTHVDHCHDTGRVRGLLCNHCNALLGHIRGDKEQTTRRAVAYLEAAV